MDLRRNFKRLALVVGFAALGSITGLTKVPKAEAVDCNLLRCDFGSCVSGFNFCESAGAGCTEVRRCDVD